MKNGRGNTLKTQIQTIIIYVFDRTNRYTFQVCLVSSNFMFTLEFHPPRKSDLPLAAFHRGSEST